MDKVATTPGFFKRTWPASRTGRGAGAPPGAMGRKASRLLAGLKGRTASAALATTAAIMLVPANLLPVLATESTGSNQTNTIYSGVKALAHQGLWAIAVIVFTASIVIPALKLAGLAWLLWHTRRKASADPHRLTQIYAAIDFIGRWSMLDVFLAAFLVGLVRFGELATVEPRGGLIAFAGAVVLTMLATEAFDPREIWSGRERDGPR